MTFLLALSAFCISIYLLYIQKTNDVSLQEEKRREKEKKQKKIQEQLLSMLGKKCEIRIGKPMFHIDIITNVQGILEDMDDEWIVIKEEGKKKNIKVIRKSMISSLKNIQMK